VSQFHANGHSAHRADLQVKDHQVDAAFFDAGDDFGAVGDFLNEEVRPFERGAQLLAQGGEVARQKNNGHWFSVASSKMARCWLEVRSENYSCPFAGEWLTCGSGSNRGGATYGDYAFGLD